MKTWKQSTFIGMVAILVLAFTLVACDSKENGNGNGNGGGNGQGLTVKNLPSIGYVGTYIYTGDSPSNEGEFKAMGNNLNPPYSPISLTAVGGVTFTESGKFLVEVEANNHSTGMSTIYKYTVANFTNGSATVDWNTMTEYD